jgi:cytochrome P450
LAPRRYPLIGDLHAFLRQRLPLLDACVAAETNVVELRIGHRAYLLKRPEDIQHVLVANHPNYAKGRRVISGYTRRVAGDSVFATDDPDGRIRRRELNPVLHGRAITGLERRVAECATEAMRRWGESAEIEILPEMELITRRAVIRAMIGPDSDRQAEALEQGLLARRRALDRAFLSPVGIPPRLPLAIAPSRRRAMRLFQEVMAELVERRSRDPVAGPDLLSLLLAPPSEGGVGMEPKRAMAELLSLSLSGYHAVARAIAWTLYVAASDATVQERIRADAAGGDSWRSLGYTRMAVAESLRLFPPTPVFLRVARADDRLPTGKVVRARANVLLSPYVVQRDPGLYPDPERFDPERFGDGARGTRPRFAYFPFAGGPRVCLGQTFATMECVLLTAKVLGRYQLHLAPGALPAPSAGLGLDPPPGLRLLAQARS